MEIKDIIIIVIVAALFLIIGLLVGVKLAFDLQDPENQETGEYLHCFQCEIEMPVKEKNGRFFCSNCGLRH